MLATAARSVTTNKSLPAAPRHHLAGQFLTVMHWMDPDSARHGELAKAFATVRATVVADRKAGWLTTREAGQLRFDLDTVAGLLDESGARQPAVATGHTVASAQMVISTTDAAASARPARCTRLVCSCSSTTASSTVTAG
jgi:hypothetical protein